MLSSETCDDPLTLFIYNVRVGTRDASPVLTHVERLKPDIVMLVETDDWWDNELRVFSEWYETKLGFPQENGYGMHFYTNLPSVKTELRFLLEPEIPSVYAHLNQPNGSPFLFLGVHPQPPVPNFKNTLPRDAELLIAGREVESSGLPSVIAGDLNDVAWSDSTQLVLRTSNLLDPRRGRGVFATFPVSAPGFRWPLDHVFHTADFVLHDMYLLEDSGSDHFPVYVSLCQKLVGKLVQESPEEKPEDKEKAEEKIDEGEREAVKRDGAEPESPLQ